MPDATPMPYSCLGSRQLCDIRYSEKKVKRWRSATPIWRMCSVEQSSSHAQKALEYLLQALPLIRECKGEYNESMAELCNSLAVAYVKFDSLRAAFSWYEKALEIEKKLYGEESAQVALLYSNLSAAYYDMKDCRTAIEYINMSIEKYKKVYSDIQRLNIPYRGGKVQ